ncbi:uncharacterized protein G2W53_023356 [Senna tora]|uniref:Uncharacterized protein n=1 Tax=Senna tora TaxID=362788 RepID=A0A834TA74_9FABA|nr:uncharacterized protein G2W53_023356 [Senna tora]
MGRIAGSGDYLYHDQSSNTGSNELRWNLNINFVRIFMQIWTRCITSQWNPIPAQSSLMRLHLPLLMTAPKLEHKRVESMPQEVSPMVVAFDWETERSKSSFNVQTITVV